MNDRPRPAVGHMPFDGHRTCAEVHPQLDAFLEFRKQRSAFRLQFAARRSSLRERKIGT